MYRVCYFVGTHGDWGGASRILFNIVRGLDRSRFEPVVMLTAEGPVCEELSARGIEYHIWPRHDFHDLIRYARWVANAVRFFRKSDIDLIHLNDGCIGWRPAEMLAARLLRLPVVNHAQQPVRVACPYARRVQLAITCSDFLRPHCDFGPVRKVAVHDVVDCERFARGRSLRKELGIAEDHVVLSFIGRARRKKGLDLFVALARRLQGEQLRFLVSSQRTAKPNEDSYGEAELDTLLGQDPRIVYSGFREDVENVYATSDVIVVPSRAPEPCPAVLCEAAASGRAVVASDAGSTSEFVSEGVNGYLVPVGDLGALAARTQQLVADPDLRRKMGAAARELAVKRYASEPLERVQHLYEELVRSRSRHSGNRRLT